MIKYLNSIEELLPGVLYLVFPDQRRIELSSGNIEAFANKYLKSPENVPDNVKSAVDYQRCSVCPKFHEEGFCHALLPSLAIFDIIENYPSYETVKAYYLDPLSKCLIVKETSLQNALHHVSILSLINYCELGLQYHDLFYMVTPLMRGPEIATRIYLNAFWLYDGDKERTRKEIKKFVDEIRVTIRCQVNRIRLISKSDALLNAFSITHVLTEIINMDLDKVMSEGFKVYKERMLNGHK